MWFGRKKGATIWALVAFKLWHLAAARGQVPCINAGWRVAVLVGAKGGFNNRTSKKKATLLRCASVCETLCAAVTT